MSLIRQPTMSACSGAITMYRPGVMHRDSKNPSGSVLTIPPPAWTVFTSALRTDDLG